MDNFSELVTNRRSVRQYTDEQLLPQEVETIMKAALMAPTSKNSRPWHFVLVEEKEMLEKLSHCKSSGCAFLSGAALAIVILTDPLLSEAYIEDAAIAASYMQLQAEDLGLGSCWIQISGRETEAGYDSEQYVRDMLEIPLQLHVGCIVALGHKAKTGRPHDESKLLWERLHIGQFRHDSEPE
ncbi:nitroreductase family protein [Bacteroidales bacterium OttesenSCG-928-A17]|nr:nitroreductase family protein [Bacteroidales bacterium OttesenSCG-928-A17]